MRTIMEWELSRVPRRTGYSPGYVQFDLDYRTGKPQDWRDQFIRKYGFPIITEQVVQEIMRHGRRFVEIGAGLGYLTHELRAAGADVVATDSMTGGYDFGKPWVEVEELDGERAVLKYMDRIMLLSWPCYNEDWSARVLEAYPGPRFVFIGENWGGCTGNDRFHNLLYEKWREISDLDIPQWEGIHDWLRVYERKALPKRHSLRWFANSLASR